MYLEWAVAICIGNNGEKNDKNLVDCFYYCNFAAMNV